MLPGDDKGRVLRMSEKASYFNERPGRHSERQPRPLGATTMFAKESGAGRVAGFAAEEKRGMQGAA